MTYIIYFLVTLFATFLGALAGLGGGLIIKPILDVLNDYSIETISLLSSFSVFTMSVVALFKNRHKIKSIKPSLLITLAASSFVGGLVGGSLFTRTVENFGESLVGSTQSFLLIIILLTVVLLNTFKRRIHLKIRPSFILSLSCGFLLGFLAAFLGIGGGPLNVLVLILIFRYSTVNAAIGSIFIIFFAQLSVILKTLFTTGFSDYDLSMLVVMLPAAVLGGLIGSILLTKIDKKYLSLIFNIVIMGVILLNIYNLFM